MATTKTIQPTGETITIPAMADQPDMSVVATDLGNITDAVNAQNQAIQTLSETKLVSEASIDSGESLITLLQNKLGTGQVRGVMLFTCTGTLPSDMQTTVDGVTVSGYGGGLVEANGYYQTLYYRDTSGNIFTAHKVYNANAWGTWHALALKSDIDAKASFSEFTNVTLDSGITAYNDIGIKVASHNSFVFLIMYITGLTANTRRKVATIPEGFRPLHSTSYAGFGGSSYTSRAVVSIMSDGNVYVVSEDTYAQISVVYWGK